MNKKSVIAALALITIGIVFGAVLVSSFKGVGLSLASFGGDVKLGASSAPLQSISDVKNLEDAYIKVSAAVRPTVVSIQATTKPQKIKQKGGDNNGDEIFPFFHFFGGPELEAQPQTGFGSGVIVTSNGYIMTNNHVIENADDGSVKVTLMDNREFNAKVIGGDPLTDIAVIKIHADDLPIAALGNSDELKIGQMVMAIGNPFRLNFTVTHGIISALGRGNLGLNSGKDGGYGVENFIQTDAVINPGNSGGALVNLSGEVIGINSAIATHTGAYEGYGFAIPMNLAKSVAEDLIKNGHVRRGYIGVQIQPVDEAMAKASGLDRIRGVIVQGLTDGGAASDAGIKEGDIILSIDGIEVNSSNALQAYVAQKHPGDVVSLEIWREKKSSEMKVKLRERKEETEKFANKEGDDNNASDAKDSEKPKSKTFESIGITARNMNSDLKEQYKVDNGIIITDVKRFSKADDQGLGKNDLILEADHKKIKSVSDFDEVIKSKKPGDAVMLRIKIPDRASNGFQIRYLAVEIAQ